MKVYVQLIKRYSFVRKYAAVRVQLEIFILQYIGYCVLIMWTFILNQFSCFCQLLLLLLLLVVVVVAAAPVVVVIAAVVVVVVVVVVAAAAKEQQQRRRSAVFDN